MPWQIGVTYSLIEQQCQELFRKENLNILNNRKAIQLFNDQKPSEPRINANARELRSNAVEIGREPAGR